MREDQSAPRAHRTGLIIFMTLCHRRGVVQEMRCLLPIDDVTNLRREREHAIQPSSCYWQRPVTPWPEYIPSPFISRRSYLITYCDDRRLGELMDVDIMNERGHGKGNDMTMIKMKQFMRYIEPWNVIRVNDTLFYISAQKQIYKTTYHLLPSIWKLSLFVTFEKYSNKIEDLISRLK